MPNVARKTDEHRGICNHGAPCCPHNVVGIVSEGSPMVFVNSLPVARLGDGVVHDCPHCGTGHITSASATVFANGIKIARIGDEVTYPGGKGEITEASGCVFN